MQDVPPVLVDIILDPFLLNVFPRSLVRTAGWITVVTAVAAVVGRWIVSQIDHVVFAAEAGMRHGDPGHADEIKKKD